MGKSYRTYAARFICRITTYLSNETPTHVRGLFWNVDTNSYYYQYGKETQLKDSLIYKQYCDIVNNLISMDYQSLEKHLVVGRIEGVV